jgi:hypothetical protein
MKRIFPLFAFMLLLFFFFALVTSLPGAVFAQEEVSLTPTYDPLKEPVVPENPNTYELGRNWYWHYCMPCHGDKGQGLTDEWRAVWEPDHQDCWGKGCHAGERIEDSFAIPTVVPAVVSGAKLARFASLDGLFVYLKTTHPPQNPGWLEDEQYRAIALYVFHENHRPLVEPTLAPTVISKPTLAQITESPPVEELSGRPDIVPYIGLGIILIVVLIWGIRKLR